LHHIEAKSIILKAPYSPNVKYNVEPGNTLDSFIDPAAEAHDKDTDVRESLCNSSAAAASALALPSMFSNLDYQHNKGISLKR